MICGRFRRSRMQNFLRRPTMVADILRKRRKGGGRQRGEGKGRRGGDVAGPPQADTNRYGPGMQMWLDFLSALIIVAIWKMLFYKHLQNDHSNLELDRELFPNIYNE